MTKHEAIEHARREADARHWPWAEPVRARRTRAFLLGPMRWRVVSNAGARGLNVVVEMDDASGRILRAHMLAH